MYRRILIISAIAAVLLLAGLPAITAGLTRIGVIGLASAIRGEYLNGTVLALVAVFMALVPREPAIARHVQPVTDHCRVCGAEMQRAAHYCPRCGSCA